MKEAPVPPAWVDKIIDRFAPPHLSEEIKGDLSELFIKDVSSKPSSARRKYALRAAGFLLKSFFWKNNRSRESSNNTIMLGSYLKTAYRSLLYYRGNTIINVLGLVIGIASAIVIITVVRFETSFDTFHSNANRIYQVVRVSGAGAKLHGGNFEYRSGVSYPVATALKDEISSIENVTSIDYFGGAMVEIVDKSGSVLNKFREDHGVVMVEPNFFKVFDFKETSFKWIQGSPEKSLSEPLCMILTKSLAKKYFPNGDAIGNTIKLDHEADFKVTGIIEDLPPNTDFPFTMLLSYATEKVFRANGFSDWVSVNDTHEVYVVLPPGISPDATEKQIAKVHAHHTSKDIHENRFYLLQKLSDIHFDARFENFTGRTISRNNIFALSIIAVFLLLTACINYINLATAQSTMRSKEIGLRKVMGSNRNNLIRQFMAETFVVVTIAGILAFFAAEFMLFKFQTLLNMSFTGFHLTDPSVLLILLTIIVLVSLFSGLYPSFVISRFNPVTVLKNKFGTDTIGGLSIRKVLVVAQFTITQILVVCTFILTMQMRQFRNVDLGFDKDAIISVPVPDRDPVKMESLETQLRSLNAVAGLTFSYTLPSGLNRMRSYRDVRRKEAKEQKDIQIFEFQSVDENFIDVYKIKLLAGRNFVANDSPRNVLINKTLARKLEWLDPKDAIGEEVLTNGKLFTVTGVFDDYYSKSMKETFDNMLVIVNPRAYRVVSIKLNLKESQDAPAMIAQVEKIWSATFPEYMFDYQFLDDNIKAFYEQEQKYSDMFQMFSSLFLAIGCLGLYGLITFVVNRKGKEVAIRKVLGASVSNILLLFSREYVLLIIVSFAIAAPVAWYAGSSWLENFAYHITLSWWMFATPGGLVLVIALAVITTKSMRTANANPVDKLKYE